MRGGGWHAVAVFVLAVAVDFSLGLERRRLVAVSDAAAAAVVV
jgi:hypothetical protein